MRRRYSTLLGGFALLLLVLVPDLVVGARTELSVYFFNVGHGDAIYVQLPNDYDIVIDAGRPGSEDSPAPILAHITDDMIADGVIELLIVTHHHQDHYGGIAALLESREPPVVVQRMVSPGMHPGEEAYLEYVRGDHARWLTVSSLLDRGVLPRGRYVLHKVDGYTLTLLAPSRRYSSTNDSSVIVRLEGPAVSVLFMGDAVRNAEVDLIKYHVGEGIDLPADVLKVGHHGSNTSTTCSLLSVVQPSVAVISADGTSHPHEDALKWLSVFGADVYQTNLHGTVILKSDGESYWIENEAGRGPRLDLPESTEGVWQPLCRYCRLNTGITGALRIPYTIAAGREAWILAHRALIGWYRFAGCLEDIVGIGEDLRATIVDHFCPPQPGE